MTTLLLAEADGQRLFVETDDIDAATYNMELGEDGAEVITVRLVLKPDAHGRWEEQP